MRLHSALGYRSPEEFAIQVAQQAAYFGAPRWSSPGVGTLNIIRRMALREKQSIGGHCHVVSSMSK
jgi:hypothetical protein